LGLTWTNRTVNPTYNRSQGFTMNWTGGNPGTNVDMTGTSTSDLATLDLPAPLPRPQASLGFRRTS